NQQNGYFDVTGNINNIDLRAWNLVKDTYIEYLAVMEEKAGASENQALPVRLNLKLNHGFFDETEITNLYINGIGNNDAWNLNLKSDVISGNVKIPGGVAPMKMDLEYLNLPGRG